MQLEASTRMTYVHGLMHVQEYGGGCQCLNVRMRATDGQIRYIAQSVGLLYGRAYVWFLGGNLLQRKSASHRLQHHLDHKFEHE